jgi:predicted nucleic acid-binding protein
MSASLLVLDASILVKALLPEAYSLECRQLLASDRRFLAPDLMPIECANVLWKKVQRDVLTPDLAARAQQGLLALAPVRVLPSLPYQRRALELAMNHGRSFCDSLYLAMAELEHATLVTADERLVHAMAATPLASRLHWIGNGGLPPDQVRTAPPGTGPGSSHPAPG